MTNADGGETRTEHGLAPVIALFGARGGRVKAGARADRVTARPSRAVVFRDTQSESSPTQTPAASEWDRTWVNDPHIQRASAQRRSPAVDSTDLARERADTTGEDTANAAEDALVRRLRTRQLSISEARRVLREREVDDVASDEILDRLERLGYLDDARLAEQVSHSAVARKGQGRRAVAQTLRARGLSREVVDATIGQLPDDEQERALDVARSRAHRVGDDPEAALRRLVGQLTRRGFSSSVAMSAARTALNERR